MIFRLFLTTSIFLLMLIAPSYADEGGIAASLLAPVDEDSWSLEAMVADRQTKQASYDNGGKNNASDAVRENFAKRPLRRTQGDEIKSLNRQVQSLKSELNSTRRKLSEQKAACLHSVPGNVSDLNQTRTAFQDELRRDLAEKQTALEKSYRDLAALRADLSRLQESVQQKDKAARDLTTALDRRSQELKDVKGVLAKQHGKRRPTISTPKQQEAYAAGLIMANELNSRLDGWVQAGVKTDVGLFRAGLEDGLAHSVRLEASVAGRAQRAFMKAVQDGVARQVADAQKRLGTLAKGRNALKSENGIIWYRERAGKTVTPGHAVKLSMTERIAGGREVSRVPSLTLRPEDNVPVVVRDGMYLPGEGGEVVAYALARDIYGELPLPAGVQPWTVMEYHLNGEPQAARLE